MSRLPANAHALKEVPYYTQNLLALFLYFLALVSVHFTLSKSRIGDKNKTCKQKMESELQIRLIPFFYLSRSFNRKGIALWPENNWRSFQPTTEGGSWNNPYPSEQRCTLIFPDQVYKSDSEGKGKKWIE